MRDILGEFYSRLKQLSNGCIVYTGSRGPVKRGYAQFYLKPPNVRIGAHEFAYILHHKVKYTSYIHHKCENTLCCNPDHLEDVSASEHMLIHKPAPFCPKGHEIVIVGRNTQGRCRECARLDSKIWKQKNPAWRTYSARPR